MESATARRRVRETKYPWISEAANILRPLAPCSRGEAVAALVQGMTARAVDVATRGTHSKVAAENMALNHLLGKTFTETNGVITSRPRRKVNLGHTALDYIKLHGKICKDKTGFTESSYRTYQRCLIRLGWITVQDKCWVWCGPETATWNDVHKENERRKKAT
jgi:hypothetical protein